MANTFTLIEARTLSSATASIELTSIPQTYTDLKLVYSLRSARSGSTRDDLKITINSNTGSNYSGKRAFASDNVNTSSQGFTGTPSDQLFPGAVPASTATVSTFSNSEMYFPNYAIAANKKSVSCDFTYENNVADNNITGFSTMLFDNTASGITTLKIEILSGNDFTEHSSVYLYGISKT